uniref:Ubiquitin-like domain-containing protein n=1 Tax=Aureoumbra lagunensis TaxID=44058 RepID=A0A7S3NPE4_9STRA|mmetsp:Transcript_22794/g.29526  ORF Transcript_22794/g.29526 Transcript_22794/m.29526 type:complete len:169 (-) Transcript_22794:165-671(-)
MVENEKTMILVKFGKEVDALPIDENDNIHSIIAKRFDIPIQRLNLICRGRKYAEGTREELIELCKYGNYILVLGTPIKDQLDEPRAFPLTIIARFPLLGRPLAKFLLVTWNFFSRIWRTSYPRFIDVSFASLKIICLFFTTLIPWPSSSDRRRPRREADPPFQRPHAD